MKHGQEVGGVILPTSDYAAEVMQPGEEALDLPTARVTSQWATILREGFGPQRSMWSDQFDVVVLSQLPVQPVVVVSAVADHALGQRIHKTLLEGDFDELAFMR